MEMRELAEKLIEAVEGIPSDKNIDGVMGVFDGIKTGMNNVWEDHLLENVNTVLFFIKMACPRCKKRLKIERTRSAVVVSPI